MDKKLLKSLSPTEDLRLRWPKLSITQSNHQEICSMNAPLNRGSRFDKLFIEKYGISLPKPGEIKTYSGGSIFWVSPGQWFITSNSYNPDFDRDLIKKFNDFPTITLQTDGWVSIDINGEACLSVLERLVKLDLNDANFSPGSATRTGCSHMTIFIQRLNHEQKFVLMGARSYAKSLIHTIIQAAENVLGNNN